MLPPGSLGNAPGGPCATGRGKRLPGKPCAAPSAAPCDQLVPCYWEQQLLRAPANPARGHSAVASRGSGLGDRSSCVRSSTRQPEAHGFHWTGPGFFLNEEALPPQLVCFLLQGPTGVTAQNQQLQECARNFHGSDSVTTEGLWGWESFFSSAACEEPPRRCSPTASCCLVWELGTVRFSQ